MTALVPDCSTARRSTSPRLTAVLALAALRVLPAAAAASRQPPDLWDHCFLLQTELSVEDGKSVSTAGTSIIELKALNNQLRAVNRELKDLSLGSANYSLPLVGAGWPARSLFGEYLPNVTSPVHRVIISLAQTLDSAWSDLNSSQNLNASSRRASSERGHHFPLRHSGATLRLAERLPINSSVRAVTIWDVRLFFCAVAVPFLVAAARLWMEWQDRMRNGGVLKRSDSYYMEENRREETGKLHKFLRSPDEDAGEPPEGTVLKNVLSGCVVALACLPESVSLSLIVGVSPLNGVWSGAFMNLCSAVVGGRPGLVSFASAAYAVVLVDITRDPQLGIGVMGVAVLFSGVVQALIGSLRLSRFVSLMPQPVLLGIINGLAIVTACSQIDHFRRGGAGTPFVDDDELMGMLSTALVSFAVAWLWPRLPVVGPLVPSTFMGMLVAVVFSMHVSPFPERSLEQVAGHRLFHGGMDTLPPWNFPPLEVDWTNKYVWHKAATAGVRLAFVGLVESLVTLMIVDQVTETRGSTTRECYGQSLGNVLCGILGLQGGCAVIGQSLINVSSGGRGRLSGISMSCSLFVAVIWLGPFISKLPAAPFIGLMTLVSLNTFSWGVIGTIRRAGVASSDSDTMVILSVMLATVFLDLAIAVLVGVIVSALMFAWNVSTRVQLEIYVDRVLDSRSFVLHSPLFFGSAEDFLRQIRVGEITQKQVVLDFSHSNVLDHVGTQAIAKITQLLQRADKRVELIGLNVDAKEIMGCAMALPGD